MVSLREKVKNLKIHEFFQIDTKKALAFFDKPAEKTIFNGDPETVIRNLLDNYGVSRFGVNLQMGP